MNYLMKTLAFGSLFFIGAFSMNIKKKGNNMSLTERWDKTFEKSENVNHQKVTFTNRYGITLVGDLYRPKELGNRKLSAIAVSGPYGAVKEQSSGLYAQTMAEKGFVTLAFDPSYTGESGGQPRNVSSPDVNSEDFSAAVDFLGTQDFVDREKIGVIGICGLGGMSLNAAAVDKRIKAVVTTSMYDMTRVMSKGYYDQMTQEERTKTLEQLGNERWKDVDAGESRLSGAGLPEKLTGEEPLFVKQYFDYYKTPRGFHPRSINSNSSWTATNSLSFMNMPILSYVKKIAPRPILIIAGSEAHSKYFGEDIFKAAAEPKELMIIPNKYHTDLYDQVEVIPFDKITKFFTQNL